MNMGTDASPVVILDIAEEEEDDDDDNDVSVLIHPPPPATARRRRRRGTHRHSAIAISVEDDEEEEEDRSLQLAIMASLFHTTPTPTPSHNYNYNPNLLNNNNSVIIDLSPELTSISDDDNDDVRVLHSYRSRNRNRRKPSSFAAVGGISIREQGESSNSNSPPYNDNDNDNNTLLTKKTTSSTFMCEICVDPKPYSASFPINGCAHTYCSDCIIKYVASKLQDNITHIPCPVPNCNGLLEPDQCRSILPPEVFDRWGSALCEALLLASEKFYCPFKDCSALLLMDDNAIITHSECPECRRLFCAQCKVGWHSGIECADFQKLNKDEREREDIMLMKLAKDNKWTRCPKCRFFVEKTQGCLFMRCRCGYTFCYNCGAPMVNHYCSNCKH